jgi:hypothetical protein
MSSEVITKNLRHLNLPMAIAADRPIPLTAPVMNTFFIF